MHINYVKDVQIGFGQGVEATALNWYEYLLTFATR